MPDDLFLLLAYEHPQNAIGSIGERIAAGFTEQGMPARCLVLPRDRALLEALAPERVTGIIALGSVSLATPVGGRPIWRHFRCPVTIYLLDAILYDLARIRTLPAFLTDAIGDPRLGLASPEDGYRRWLGDVLPVRWTHLPFASIAPPPRGVPAPGGDDDRSLRNRFCVIGNIGRELGDCPAGEGLNPVLRRKLAGHVSEAGLRNLAEALRSPDAHVLPAQTVCQTLDITPDRALRSDLLPALIAIDSWVKRDRRLRAMRSAAGLSVDFFGTGWQALLGDIRDFRHMGQIGHHEIAARLGRYRALINFDPNWTHGVHGRVYSALDAGCGVLTQVNEALDVPGEVGAAVLTYDTNRPALAERVAGAADLRALAASVKVPSWADRVSGWLAADPNAIRSPADIDAVGIDPARTRSAGDRESLEREVGTPGAEPPTHDFSLPGGRPPPMTTGDRRAAAG